MKLATVLKFEVPVDVPTANPFTALDEAIASAADVFRQKDASRAPAALDALKKTQRAAMRCVLDGVYGIVTERPTATHPASALEGIIAKGRSCAHVASCLNELIKQTTGGNATANVIDLAAVRTALRVRARREKRGQS